MAVDGASPEPRVLCAGPVLVELHGPDLRYARTAANEVMRRVYMAVRDRNWNTLPVTIGEPEVEEGDGEFRVRFEARNAQGDIDLAWTGTIEGARDGTIAYGMDAVAGSGFAFAKIGLCVHHAVRETAGRLFLGAAPHVPVGGELPRLIGPQIHLAQEGWDLPLFEPAEWFEIDLPHGERVRFDFEGDLFEMEDQRNWTDASFKTASTPAARGYHHTIEPGGRIRQRVVMRVETRHARAPRPRGAEPPVLRLGEPLGVAMPPLGLGSASDGAPLGDAELEALRELAPAHLRVDLRPGELDAARRAAAEADALGCGLEVALFVNRDTAFVDAVAEALAGAPVERILVFDDAAEATPLEQVELVRERFTRVPVGGGTNVYFNELNRNRPDPDRLDVVAYSVNPQIHAFDDLSLVENVAAQADTVRSARAFCGDRPIAVSPITLRPRFNAVATVEEDVDPDRLPWQVDPRQTSPFAAAWTVGSVKHLAEAGAASLTYYETAGWRGVLEREAGAPSPAFPSAPGQRFPLFHVLADACAWRGRELRECASSDPLAAVGLAAGGSLLVANLRPRAATVLVEGRRGPAELLRLSDATLPERRRERVEDASRLQLGPHEVVRVDP